MYCGGKSQEVFKAFVNRNKHALHYKLMHHAKLAKSVSKSHPACGGFTIVQLCNAFQIHSFGV